MSLDYIYQNTLVLIEQVRDLVFSNENSEILYGHFNKYKALIDDLRNEDSSFIIKTNPAVMEFMTRESQINTSRSAIATSMRKDAFKQAADNLEIDLMSLRDIIKPPRVNGK